MKNSINYHANIPCIQVHIRVHRMSQDNYIQFCGLKKTKTV